MRPTRLTMYCESVSALVRVLVMSSRNRRSYGAAKERPVLHGRVRPECKTKVDELADTRGISQAQALELILDCVAVTTHGDIVWRDYEAQYHTPTDLEALPLDETA